LATDTFELNGKTVHIKQLKIKHQKQFAKTLSPFIEEMAISAAGMGELSTISTSDFLLIASSFVKNMDVLPKFIQILAHNDNYEITEAELDECTIPASKMQSIVLKCWKQGGEFEREIADFFESALKQGLGSIRKLMAATKAEWAKEDSTSTPSSKRSAKTMATSGTKSTNS
jgi:hypothetical protein